MFIYTEQDIRKADQYAHKNGLSVNALMETAGRSLFEEVKKLVRQNESILILSGRGNNGGDGIVLARYLKQNGYQVDLVLPFGEPKTNTSLEHFQFYKANGFSYSLKINKQKKYDCIIDALLGVGTKLPLSEEYNEVVRWCNDYDALKIAVDLPTGVMADTGDVGEAFQADYTFSLHGVKPSTFFTPANRFFGRIRALDIGIPHKSNWRTWTKEDCLNTLERRKIDAHKGTFGTGLLLAATNEMPGSAILAALGAMRMGIGKLMVGTTQYAASVIASVVPEATYWFNGLEKVANGEVPEGIKACAVGPGLTDEKLVDHALATLWDQDLPIILDAGALKERQLPKRKAPVIITPHPGEFSRLTGLSTKEIQKNRIQLASEYARKHQYIVILKGAYTVIAFPDGSGYVNTTGNPGLAKGGSGDTLTGMLLALICNEKNVKAACANAVYLHGLCADELIKERDERAIVASDLSNILGKVLKNLYN